MSPGSHSRIDLLTTLSSGYSPTSQLWKNCRKTGNFIYSRGLWGNMELLQLQIQDQQHQWNHYQYHIQYLNQDSDNRHLWINGALHLPKPKPVIHTKGHKSSFSPIPPSSTIHTTHISMHFLTKWLRPPQGPTGVRAVCSERRFGIRTSIKY